MKTKSKNQAGVKVVAGVKAGGFAVVNANRKLLSVKSGIKAGEGILAANHSRRLSKNQAGVKVVAGVKAGGFAVVNANRKLLSVKSGIKAGEGILAANHNRSLA